MRQFNIKERLYDMYQYEQSIDFDPFLYVVFSDISFFENTSNEIHFGVKAKFSFMFYCIIKGSAMRVVVNCSV